MRPPEFVLDLRDWARSLSGYQAALRALIVVAAVLSLELVRLAGSGLVTWTALITVALIAWTVGRPDSPAGVCLVLMLAGLWFSADGNDRLTYSLPGALCLLLIHAATAHASLAPAAADFPRLAALHWLRDTALVGLLTAVVWGAATALDRWDAGGSVFLSAAAVFGLAAIAGFLHHAGRIDEVSHG